MANKAKVIVSEASRLDAHKLDDLYERWRLRKESTLAIYPAQSSTSDFKYSEPENYEEAGRLRDKAVAERIDVQARLQELRVQKKKVWYELEWAELTSRLNYIEAWQGVYKRYIKNNRPREINATDLILEGLEKGDATYELLCMAYDVLRQLGMSKRVVYDEKESLLIGTIRLHLEKSSKLNKE